MLLSGAFSAHHTARGKAVPAFVISGQHGTAGTPTHRCVLSKCTPRLMPFRRAVVMGEAVNPYSQCTNRGFQLNEANCGVGALGLSSSLGRGQGTVVWQALVLVLCPNAIPTPGFMHGTLSFTRRRPVADGTTRNPPSSSQYVLCSRISQICVACSWPGSFTIPHTFAPSTRIQAMGSHVAEICMHLSAAPQPQGAGSKKLSGWSFCQPFCFPALESMNAHCLLCCM